MEMLINYNLRSVNNTGVNQSVLMPRLVYAIIVRKSTTCKSDFLEKRLSSSKCFNNDSLKQNGETLIVESSSIIF